MCDSDSSSSERHKRHQRKHHKCPKKHKCPTYDYIIVGDGAAGCIVARKLSDKLNCKNPRVLVLERGANQIQPFGYPPNPTILRADLISPGEFTDPNSDLNVLTNDPKYAQNYIASVNSATLDPILSARPPFNYSTGNGWGGGGSHFYMLGFRGTPALWNDYAAINGSSSWNYASLLPIFKSLETYTPFTGSPLNTAERGVNGPISLLQLQPLSIFDPASPTVDSIMEAFETHPEVGCGYVTDFNTSAGTVGGSAMQFYNTPPIQPTRFGQYRSWSHNSFLPIGTIIDADGDGLKGRNLKIQSNALVKRVLFSGKKAIGVEYIDTIKNATVRVFGKQIILCAGCMEDPQILQRSGVGDATLLTSLGVPVVLNNPNVGANMEGHASVSVGIVGSLPLAMGGFGGIMVDLHDTSRPFGDPFKYPADGKRRVFSPVVDGSLLGSPGVFLAEVLPLQSNFKGTVKITSTDPTVAPAVNFNYYSDDLVGTVNGSTLNKAMAGLYNIKKVIDTNGYTLAFPPASTFSSDANLADFVKGSANFQHHQSGTCRFGTSVANGVVDSNLNVMGLKNLKVASLSVYPYTADGNPMYSAMTAGVKCAQSFGVSIDPIL